MFHSGAYIISYYTWTPVLAYSYTSCPSSSLNHSPLGMEVTSILISFGTFHPALQKHSAHCSYLINIGSLPEGSNWQPSHKEFTVVHKFTNLIFLCSSERWLTKYFLILVEINSGNQTRKGTKCHLHSWLAKFVTTGFSVCES